MPEDLNAEVAGALAEAGDASPPSTGSRWERTVEILEAVVLAVVAVATAWSGYQAARWDGHQAELYGQASTTRVEADQQLTLGGQQKLLDVTTFNTWIEAKNDHRPDLAALAAGDHFQPAVFQQRFTGRVESERTTESFRAWRAIPLGKPALARRQDVLGLLDERTGQRRNDRKRSARIQFGVGSIGATQHMTDELQHGVLKTAARAEEGYLARARPFDGPQRAVGVCIRTVRHTPDGVEGIQHLRGAERRGMNPVRLNAREAAGQPHRFIDRAMRGDVRREIAYQRNTNTLHLWS